MFRQRFTLLAAASLALGAALVGSQAAGSPAAAAAHDTVHLARASAARQDRSVNGLRYAQRAYRSPARRATFPVNVCVLPAKSQCMNDWDGNLGTYVQAVRFYHYGNSGGNNRILVIYINTISGCGTSGGFQPFANGSGLNCRYNGRPVYHLQWAKNGPSGVCIASDDTSQYAFNFPCNGGPGTWFVYSSSSYLVGVGASNVLYDDTLEPNAPVWLGDVTGDGNGAHVYSTSAQSLSLTFGFNSDGG